MLGPVNHFLERRRIDVAAPELRIARASDEARPLEHAEVFRYARQAHVEGLGQLGDRALAGHEPGQNRPPCRVGKGGKRESELIGGHVLNH